MFGPLSLTARCGEARTCAGGRQHGGLSGGALMTTITIELPEELVEEAKSQGLLAARAVEAMIRDALCRRAGRELLDAANELAAAELPLMTMAEIQREVDAVRADRRRRAAGA